MTPKNTLLVSLGQLNSQKNIINVYCQNY